MLFSNSKKIVVVKDIPSNIIEEAIFILKNEPAKKDGEKDGKEPVGVHSKAGKDYLLKEAEAVINSYIIQNKYNVRCSTGISLKVGDGKKKLITNLAINATMVASIALLIFVISRFF